jgi:ABC-type glutathione transport system ATPase component
MSALLEVRDLGKTFGRGSKARTAIENVNFDVGEHETVGLVGESGSGKTTTLRCVLGLERPDTGTISFEGVTDPGRASSTSRTRFQRQIQVVAQDPFTSLDPRMTIAAIVSEPLLIAGERDKRTRRGAAAEALRDVALDSDVLDRYPRSFSGGQRQRIAIARAIVTRPRLLVCDEAVSALDVSVQADILDLLKDMRAKLDLSILFVAHDLAVVRYLCDRVLVMHDGTIVESGDRDAVFESPAQQYTRDLIAAIPGLDPSTERENRHNRIRAARMEK